MINQNVISINPCHKCTNGTCPCESYKDYLDHLYELILQDLRDETHEINEVMDGFMLKIRGCGIQLGGQQSEKDTHN